MTHFRDDVHEANNVLLLAPPMADREPTVCTDLLQADPSSESNVLVVTLTDSPAKRVQVWRQHVGETFPAELVFVTGDERSAGGRAWVDGETDESVRVSSAAHPGDLTGLGVEVTRHLERWRDAEAATSLCFHTVSTLLQYADRKSVYRFLHTLTVKVTALGGTAHYHASPVGYDETALDALLPLFDAVVELEDDRSELDVRT